MRQDIRLYIGGMEVEFQSTPEIFYNYTIDDLTNPTIVKNSYSKAFTIEGTPQNNKIFGQFWNMERLQKYGASSIIGSNFNPSQKVPFQLFLNGEVYESGYVKLENVRKNGNAVYYDIQLFGGLGELFYILSFDDMGNKLSLADLSYMPSGSSNEFDFVINKEAVQFAWNEYGMSDDRSLWHYINFAPCYNGLPDNFSSDKCLINFNGSALFSSTTSGTTTYSSVGGYSLGTLPAEMGEWSTRDLRSYLQRPVLRMKEVINACVKYASQYGYEIDYDEKFFNSENPYWNKTWITLSKLSELPVVGTEEGSTTDTPVVTKGTRLTTGEAVLVDLEEAYTLSTEGTEGEQVIDFSFKICQKPSTASTVHMSGKENLPIYTSSYLMNKFRELGGVAVQILCFDGTDLASSHIIGGSDTIILATKLGGDYVTAENSGLQQFYGAPVRYSFGQFNPVGNFVYKWSEELSLRVNVPANTAAIAIDVQQISNGMRGEFYLSQNIPEIWRWTDDINTLAMRPNSGIVLADASATIYGASSTAGRSGALITKQMLLSTEDTPADYLLSYCKLFGLYFLKESNSKKVHIMTRDTFYETGNTVDLEGIIDRGKDTFITPLTFDAKWYDFQYEPVGGDFYEKYKTTYGREYGIQRVNTGYDFNADAKGLLNDNVFKGAVQGTQRSQYMLAPLHFAPSYQMPSYVLQGFSYELYDADGKATTVTMDVQQFQKEALGSVLYYDKFSKPQFEDAEGKGVDGKNVLLLFNGFFDTAASGGTQVPYWITDDLSIMGALNGGNPCWLYLENEYSEGGNRIAYKINRLPVFGRYILNQGTGYITRSMDFGEPKELYIPEGVTREESTIYYNYWKNFISDMYDVNSRILECYVVLNEKPNPKWLRRFYWFDNSIWRLNKITDWNAASFEPTKMEFIKVQDKRNYTLTPVTEYSELQLILDTYTIGATGGTINGRVVIPDGGNWGMEYSNQYMSVVPESGTGDSNIAVTIQSYTGNTDRQFYLSVQQETSAARTITQKGLGLSIAGSPSLYPMAGGTGTINITANEGVSWSIQMDATVAGVHYDDWLILSQYSGTGNATITATAPENPSGITRQEYIYLIYGGRNYGNITMSQRGTDYRFDVSPSGFTLESNETAVTINIDTNYTAWTTTWYGMITGSSLSENTTYGAGTYQHTVQLEENTSSITMNSAVLYKVGTTAIASVPITQHSPRNPISVTPTTLIFPAAASALTISITDSTNNGWTVAPTSSWLTASEYEGTGNANVAIYATENETGSLRTSIVVVNDKVLGGSTTIQVQQSS